MAGVAVTVAIPTFARPSRLARCVEALGAQAFGEPWEVVIVDDGSPEPVSPAIGALAQGVDVRVIRQENAGPAAARNRAAAEARGSLIAFTDDDCAPEPGWLAELVDAGRTREGALVGGSILNGLPDDAFASTSQLILDLVYEHFNADLERAYFLASNNILCSRARYLEIGGFDGSFPRAGGEDRDFCDRWRMRGWPIAWQPRARVVHRHPQDLRAFMDMYVRYGRGAFLYKAKRRARASGSMREDLGFHGTVPRRAWHHLRRTPGVARRLKMLAALGVWQLANAAGFAAEGLDARRGAGRSA